MGLLVLGVEIIIAIKEKRENKTMSPEQIFVRDIPLDIRHRKFPYTY
jgi:hypothetical protein